MCLKDYSGSLHRNLSIQRYHVQMHPLLSSFAPGYRIVTRKTLLRILFTLTDKLTATLAVNKIARHLGTTAHERMQSMMAIHAHDRSSFMIWKRPRLFDIWS